MPKIDDAHKRLLDAFASVLVLDEAATADIVGAWRKSFTLKRNDFLVSAGEVDNHLYFILDGTMRIFYPHNDEEICVGFAYTGNIICSYPSFIQQAPSQYAIQALSKSNAIAINRKDFYGLFDKHPAVERIWRILQEQALVGKINREVELLTFTPEERYERLMKRSPHIFQLIPRKYIASYLRMTPERLSRIKPS